MNSRTKQAVFGVIILSLIVLIVASDVKIMPIGLLLAIVFVLSNEFITHQIQERFTNSLGPALQNCALYGNSHAHTGSHFYPLSTDVALEDDNFSHL